MTRFFSLALGAALFLLPSFAFAATASIGAINPQGGKAGVGTAITFSMITSGFSNPKYYVTDSFKGGVTTSNMDAQGNFYWVPNGDDVGTHVITVLVTDVMGNTASASYSFDVVAPEIAPASLPAASLQYGSTVSFSLTYTGFTNPTITVEDAFPNSSVTSSNLVGATFTWTPQKKDVGTHKLTISARDAGGRFHSTTQTITVLGLPTLSILSLSPGTTVGAGQAFSFVATTTELSSPEITVQDLFYSSATTTFAWDGRRLTWTPVYNDVGVHLFTLKAVEPGTGRSASAEVRVTVSPYAVALAPSAASTASVAPAAPASSTAGQGAASGAAASGSSYVFSAYLGVGSTGVAVTELQKKLVALGFLAVEPTGYFGSLTKKAVQEFQKANGLEQVGFLGPLTRAALNKK